MKKLLTANKFLPCIYTDGWYVIKKDNGTFTFHDTTNTVDPLTNIRFKLLLPKIEFDETPYIEALNDYKGSIERARLAIAEEEVQRESKRLQKLKDLIIGCETPSELADKFGFEVIETASHWSDLYGGRSNYAVLLNDRQDYEVMELAKELLDIQGEFGKCKNRAGEHHHTFSRTYSLESYQDDCKRHFNGDHYFYKGQDETEEEYILEKIKDCADSLDEVRSIIKDYDELETGYYDCNGGLMMLEETLEDPDFSGYTEDVYSYQFGFEFQFKYQFNNKEDDDTEDED